MSEAAALEIAELMEEARQKDAEIERLKAEIESFSCWLIDEIQLRSGKSEYSSVWEQGCYDALKAVEKYLITERVKKSASE